MTITPPLLPALTTLVQPPQLTLASGHPHPPQHDRPRAAAIDGAATDPGTGSDFAAAVGRAALGWHRSHLTGPAVVQAILDTAAALLPGAVGAALLTRQDTGHLHLSASAGVLPPRVQALHRDHGEPHPHLTAPPTPPARTAPGRQRGGWPIATTIGHGRTALTYIPLGLGDVVFGTLLINTDTPHPHQVTAEHEIRAITLAMHACTALAAARDRDHLRTAVDTRDLIGQAKGILMERRRLTADAAYTELVRISTTTNTKLRDLCAYLCATGELPVLRTTNPR